MDPVSPVVFETERLYAREFVKDDADGVFEYAGNIESSGFQPFSPESYEDVVKFVESRLAEQLKEKRGYFDLVLCLKDTDEMVGAMGLYLSEDRRQGELGYNLKKRFWGRGYATEAARGFLRFGFLGLELHRITAKCDDRNAASYRVMERLGMRREAHFIKDTYTRVFGRMGWRNTYHYAILQKEFLASLPDGEYDPALS